MTKTEYGIVMTGLRNWRLQRQLDVEKQREGLIPNLMEEFTELFRSNNEYEKIDAYCDMMVFIFNAFSPEELFLQCDESLIKREANMFDEDDLTLLDHLITLIRSFESHTKFNTLDTLMNVHSDMMSMVFHIESILRQKGYSPYQCLFETLKEIDSRTGEYDEVANKFIKDIGFYREDVEAEGGFDLLHNLVRGIDNPCIEHTPNYWIIKEGDGGREVMRVAKWYKADYEKCKIKSRGVTDED